MRLALLIGWLVGALVGQDPAATAASVTEPGRTLKRPLDIVLGGPSNRAMERTVLLLLDPSNGLRDAGFADEFAAAIRRNQKLLANTSIGLATAGEDGALVEPPTREHERVVAATRRLLAGAGADLVNVYEGLRRAAEQLSRAKGDRVVLLVTLENGDLEDDVEKTIAALRKQKVTVEVLASETTLSDSYWASRPNANKPRGTSLTGGDGAVTEVPWGFLLQDAAATEATPSGYAMWGLTRVAAGTEGRVFLYASAAQVRHSCSVFGRCLFCDGDHRPPLDAWNSALVTQVAPLATTRAEAYRLLGRDPCFRALIKSWTNAAKAGLLRSQPGVKLRTTSASPDRQRWGRSLGLFDTAAWARNAKRAVGAAKQAGKLRDELVEQLDALGPEAGSHRSRASARYMTVLLQLTRVNLISYAAWCREYAPKWFDERADLPQPPEVPVIGDDRRPHGVHYFMMSLCHGVRPFYSVELPGGEELRRELQKLEAMFNGFQHRYGRSPFGYALRRNGIARYYPTFPAISRGPVRRRPKSSNAPKGPITPKRPPRRGGGSSGGTGGPTTGGGR